MKVEKLQIQQGKYARIKNYKVYTLNTKYGNRLCGFRGYDKENVCVISAGWFDPNYLEYKEFKLGDDEVISGFSSYRHSKYRAVHYDVIFNTTQVSNREDELWTP